MNSVTIRAANEKDVQIIAAMDKVCFSLPWSEESFYEEITRNKTARYMIAEVAGKIVGYAGVWLILDEGHITNIAVHPDFRRKGIGKALISALISVSYEEGVMKFTLEVRASNTEAISLYKCLNFIECGVRKKYYEDDGEDAVIMWKE